MNGLIVINKPISWTSRDVVNKCNHIFHTKKIGHTGTLDPIASGVLVLCIGNYTKLVNEITSYDKEYIAKIKLGIKTDTLDTEGNIVAEDNNINITKEMIEDVFKNFPKSYMQEVPKFSAVKLNGRKLYEYARENKEVELPKRNVSIYSIELISYENNIIEFKTSVSKGTYIRTLIQDICNNLNVYGTMCSLIRTKQGSFTIDKAINIEDINENIKLIEASEILDVKRLDVNEHEFNMINNGNKINKEIDNGYYDIYYENKKIALYNFENNIGRIIIKYE